MNIIATRPVFRFLFFLPNKIKQDESRYSFSIPSDKFVSDLAQGGFTTASPACGKGKFWGKLLDVLTYCTIEGCIRAYSCIFDEAKYFSCC